MHAAHQSQAHNPQVTPAARQRGAASAEAPQQKNTESPALQRDLGNRYLQMAAAGHDASPEGDVEDCPDCAQQQVQTYHHRLARAPQIQPAEIAAKRGGQPDNYYASRQVFAERFKRDIEAKKRLLTKMGLAR